MYAEGGVRSIASSMFVQGMPFLCDKILNMIVMLSFRDSQVPRSALALLRTLQGTLGSLNHTHPCVSWCNYLW